MKKRGKRKNFPNGCYTEEEWIRLVVDKDSLDTYRRKLKIAEGGSKCPPLELIENGACFYCQDCITNCASYVKEYKNHYMVRNIKYLKSELGELNG